MVELRDDIKLALNRVAFAEELGMGPDSWQRDLLRSDSKRILLNVSRQAGKSTCAAILALHRVLYYPGSLVLCLAPALRQSQELFAKIGTFYSGLGEPMRKYGERRLSLELTNGSRIVTLPGTERTVRGYSGVDVLLVDEAARVDDDLYFAIRPMLAVSGGSLIMLSTPYGKRGAFFDSWEHGGPSWERYKVPAIEVPRISDAFLEEERSSMPERVFRQEYMCSFEETDDAVFSYDDIDAAITDDVTPLFEEVS
jgi:hypothetical protein